MISSWVKMGSGIPPLTKPHKVFKSRVIIVFKFKDLFRRIHTARLMTHGRFSTQIVFSVNKPPFYATYYCVFRIHLRQTVALLRRYGKIPISALRQSTAESADRCCECEWALRERFVSNSKKEFCLCWSIPVVVNQDFLSFSLFFYPHLILSFFFFKISPLDDGPIIGNHFCRNLPQIRKS